MIKNSLHSISPDTTKLFGIYRGVVEDNKSDIDKSGRIKVRIFGVHTAKKEETETSGISTDHLPWSEPVLSLFEGSVSGNGAWTVPLQGSHVFVFFENGNPIQPRYFASAPGMPSEAADNTKGFNDPDGVYPIFDEDTITTTVDQYNNVTNSYEPDAHRLHRGVSDDENMTTVIDTINDNLETSVSIANSTTTWSEPDSSYAAEYPHNIVLNTHGDLLIEIDSTPDNRRFHIYHPSHSYMEINENGRIITKNKKEKYEIVGNTKYQKIKGSSYLTINGSRYKYIGSDEQIYVNNDQKVVIGDSVTKKVGKDEKITVSNDFDRTVDGSYGLDVGSTTTIDSGSSMSISSGSGISINGSSSVNINASNIDISGNVSLGGDSGGGSSSDSSSTNPFQTFINDGLVDIGGGDGTTSFVF